MIPAARGWRGNYPLWLPLTQGENMLHCYIEAHSRVRFFGGGGAVLLHCGSFSRR